MLSHLFIDEPGAVPKFGLRLFRGLFATGCLLFVTALISGAAWERQRATRWPAVTCHVTDCRVTHYTSEGERRYGLEVAYQFDFAGSRLHGHDGRNGPGEAGVTSEDAGTVYAHAERYPPGTVATCRVNPDEPTRPLLEPGHPTPMIAGALLLAVATAAATAFYSIPQWTGSWFVRRAAEGPDRRRRRERQIGAAALVIGTAFFVGEWGLPLQTAIRATRWPSVPCTIVEAGVATNDVHGEVSVRLYRPDVLYTYEFAGRRRFANGYDPLDFNSMLRAGKQSIVDRYPAGAMATCRVNPTDPYEAYLALSPGSTYLSVLFPLTIIALGILIIWKRSPSQD